MNFTLDSLENDGGYDLDSELYGHLMTDEECRELLFAVDPSTNFCLALGEEDAARVPSWEECIEIACARNLLELHSDCESSRKRLKSSDSEME